MALTLQFRPKSFAELIGQESIVSILSRQVATKTWKNAYLFCGSHGCGKTSTARIFASEINNGEGSPIELDCASNNGIDTIRGLVADAQQSSLDCEYKVYILDEANNLSRAAWDASLKLIEEPPRNSIFIFCTTAPEKIPDTILSRVQRFDFRRVSKDLISDRLAFILNEGNHRDYEKSALDRIAALSDGHVRDAIQLLEKCLDASDSVTNDVVESVLGLVKYSSVMNIIRSMTEKNLSKCIEELTALKSHNANMVNVFDTIMGTSIDAAIYAQTNDISFTGIPEDYKNILSTDIEFTKTVVERFSEFRNYVSSSNAETLLKTIFVEVCGRGE